MGQIQQCRQEVLAGSCNPRDQLMKGADLSLVTVGFSWMLAKGF